MFCPIFTAASIAHQGRGDKIIDQCEEQECAWYDSIIQTCLVYSIHTDLAYLCARLKELVDKMPHEEQFRK